MSEAKPNLSRIFAYHAPTAEQADRYGTLRDQARTMAMQIEILCPDSREKSLAITKLREATMWANASIACNE